MPTYDTWKEKTLNVASLSLDSQNPRIPSTDTQVSQRDIAADLIRHDDVYELAKNITNLGFFPTERLIAVEENGQTVIVEGNRRLAALKLLLSPAFAPEEFQRKFQLLQSGASIDDFKKVKVLIAPSREAAAPLIIDRHTHTGVSRWERAQQAKYLRTLMKPGVSIDDVASKYGIPRSDLIDALKTDTMYKIACSLDLEQHSKSIVTNPRKFSATTLDRLVQSRTAQEFLGIKFDRDGRLTGAIDPAEFKKTYTRVISDIANERVDSRKLNSNAEITSYFKGLGKDLPDKSRKGAFTADSLLADSPSEEPAEIVPRKRAKMQKSAQVLIPAHVRCSLTNKRILTVHRELRKLRVAEYINGCAVLFRVFLELVVSHYLDETEKIKPLLEKAKSGGRKADWYPTLRMMLQIVVDDQDLVVSPLARKAARKLLNDENNLLSTERMDQFVHNRFVVPTEGELRAIWESLEPFVVELLKESKSKP